MKPATSFCRTRRLPGMMRCTSTNPPTAIITARQTNRRPTTMRTQSLLRAPLPELPDEREDTSFSREGQYPTVSARIYGSGLTILQDAIARMRAIEPKLLAGLFTLQRCSGTQPQRDVGWLHRFPHHPHKVLVQRLGVRLVPELCRERFEGLSRVVLASVEATVDEGLDASPQGIEQGRDHKGRGHYH